MNKLLLNMVMSTMIYATSTLYASHSQDIDVDNANFDSIDKLGIKNTPTNTFMLPSFELDYGQVKNRKLINDINFLNHLKHDPYLNKTIKDNLLPIVYNEGIIDYPLFLKPIREVSPDVPLDQGSQLVVLGDTNHRRTSGDLNTIGGCVVDKDRSKHAVICQWNKQTEASLIRITPPDYSTISHVNLVSNDGKKAVYSTGAFKKIANNNTISQRELTYLYNIDQKTSQLLDYPENSSRAKPMFFSKSGNVIGGSVISSSHRHGQAYVWIGQHGVDLHKYISKHGTIQEKDSLDFTRLCEVISISDDGKTVIGSTLNYLDGLGFNQCNTNSSDRFFRIRFNKSLDMID